MSLGILAAPGAASAAVRFGSDLSSNAAAASPCPNMAPECSAVLTGVTGGERAGSPIDGVVTRWRTRAAVAGNITFQVVRRSGANQYRVVATDTQVGQQNSVTSYSVRIPIRDGDLLGLDAAGAGEPLRATTGRITARFAPALGSASVAATQTVSDTELLVNAVVEPDADGDGFGDDSQDECPTDPSTQGGCSATLVGPPLNQASDWAGGLVTFGSARTVANGDAASPDGSRIPSDGVVVRWRIRSAIGTWAPQAVRPEGGGTYRSIATGDEVEVAAPNDQPNAAAYIRSFPTRLPVRAGDVFGVRAGAESSVNGRSGTSLLFAPVLADGESRAPSNPLPLLLAVNADLEPDADGDGFGDLTQDGCPTNATTQGACPPGPPPSPPPPTPDPFGVADLVGGLLRYGGGRVLRVPVACPATAERCRGVLEARANVRGKKAGASRIVRLGRARFGIPGGESRTLRVRLSRQARRALRSVRRLRVTIVVTPSGPGAVRRSVTLLRPR